MIFLLDENFPSKSWLPISRFFDAKHTFLQAGRDFDKGTKDPDLFRLAASECVDTIITADIRQIEGMDRQHERIVCRDAGLHWVGVPRSPKARGKNIWHGQLAQLLGAMQFIVSTLEGASEPQAILLSDGGHSSPCQKGYPQALKQRKRPPSPARVMGAKMSDRYNRQGKYSNGPETTKEGSCTEGR